MATIDFLLSTFSFCYNHWMTKRKLGTRIDSVHLVDGPYLEESLKSTKWRKKGKLQRMPQPVEQSDVKQSAASFDDQPVVDAWNGFVYEDVPAPEARQERLPVRSKVGILVAYHVCEPSE